MTQQAYQQASPVADKLLEPDGSIVTRSGTVIAGPDPQRAQAYLQASPIADKLLAPDGSITTGLGIVVPQGYAIPFVSVTQKLNVPLALVSYSPTQEEEKNR